MSPRRDPVPRAREAASWLGGILLVGILGGGVVAAAMVLWENIDLRELVPELASAPEPVPTPRAPAPPNSDGASFEAVLFDSPRNAAYFPDSAYHPAAIRGWRGLVEELGGRVRIARDAGGLQALDPAAVMVVPESPCLAGDERAAIRAHLDRGGAVVANWAVGARDGDCEWLGWETVASLTGAEDVREIPSRDALFLTVPDGLPLSPGLDPGTRIGLRPDPSLALWLSGPRVYWSDWALNPAPDESGGGADAAAVATISGDAGRVAWFGLRAGQGVTPVDSLRLRRMIQNGILWAAGRPQATPAAWPGARRAAAVVTVDVESEAENGIPVAEAMRSSGIDATFFVVSRLVRDDADLARALVSAGEVATQTADHAPVADLPRPEQLVRLRRAVEEVEDWSGERPVGLRPPEERFDAATVTAWSQAGGRYLVGLNEARSASPEVHASQEDSTHTVILLPRLLKDDYNVFVQDGAVRSRRLEEAYLEGLRKLRAVGGVAVISGHTQILRTPARIDAMVAAVDSIRGQGDWWLARGREVAEWWRGREAVTIRMQGADPEDGAPLVRFEVEAGESVSDLWVQLVLPGLQEDWIPLVEDTPVEHDRTPWGARIPVGDMEPGEVRRVVLVPDRDSSGP